MIKGFSHSVYFAPRGKRRLLSLGNSIAQRYLDSEDNFIGFIGDAGAGKSVLIRGMFPGLTLTNDDSGINIRPLPILDHFDEGRFSSHTYHLDLRFESAFSQMWEMADAIEAALNKKRRVIIEHYDLIAPLLKYKAQVIIGVGEEVVITRPRMFGPRPEEIRDIVYTSIQYRRMAHTAEDLTAHVIEEMGYERPPFHSDVRSGFILEFEELPDLSIVELKQGVDALIKENIKVALVDDDHISLGGRIFPCTSPRLHVKRTGEIEGFSLAEDFIYDSLTHLYLLPGRVGRERSHFRLLKS